MFTNAQSYRIFPDNEEETCPQFRLIGTLHFGTDEFNIIESPAHSADKYLFIRIGV